MKLRKMTMCGIFAAMLAVCAWLSVPIGDVAVTMQTFGLLLCLGVLGGKLGCISCTVYLLLGAVGLPVFSGFQGGFGVLLGPTGGYLWGFLLSCGVFWALEKRMPLWLNFAMALLVCYTCGTAWYAFAYGPMPIWPILLKCVLPYLIPDAIKLVLSWVTVGKIKKHHGK